LFQSLTKLLFAGRLIERTPYCGTEREWGQKRKGKKGQKGNRAIDNRRCGIISSVFFWSHRRRRKKGKRGRGEKEKKKRPSRPPSFDLHFRHVVSGPTRDEWGGEKRGGEEGEKKQFVSPLLRPHPVAGAVRGAARRTGIGEGEKKEGEPPCEPDSSVPPRQKRMN